MNKKYKYLIVIALILAAFITFGRIVENDFINFDDNESIFDNNNIKSGITLQSIQWAFTSLNVFYWQPFTWLSHMLDWSLFGANASGHHLVSLLLHTGAVVLLFLFLSKMTGNLWSSAFAAMIFALHPLRVESVAWATERKDVLSMFFGMACLYVYAFYAEKKKLSLYLLCVFLFAFALMSKPVMVTLPFVMILLDYWPLKRLMMSPDANKLSGPVKEIILEKFPLIVFSIASGILTIISLHGVGSVPSFEHLSFYTRITHVTISYAAYLGKIFYPVNLAVFYPYDYSFVWWKFGFSVILLVFITLAAIYHVRKLPFLFVGWFWYLGTMIPLVGLIQAGPAMADRHTYLPSIGIAIIISWGLPVLLPHTNLSRKILLPAGIAVLATLAFLTWKQCGYWKNSIELFSHTIHVTGNNPVAHNNRGVAYAKLDRDQQAIKDFNEAVRLQENYALAYNNRGISYAKLGQYQKAFGDFHKAILLQPDNFLAYINSGTTYVKTGHYQNAIGNFDQAIRLKPDYAEAYLMRGTSYFLLEKYERGCFDARKACELGNCEMLKNAEDRGYCFFQ